MPEPQRPDVEARLLRTEDLIDLTLAAYGCHLEPGDPTGVLVADDDALLVVGIPPQHVGEEVWQLIPPGSKVEAPPPPGPSRHSSAVASAALVPVHVDEGRTQEATWAGTIRIPDATPIGLRRPGGPESTWRVVVEEQELLDADSTDGMERLIGRLVYADHVAV